MATGGGKTAVFLTILHTMLDPGKRALILAHRKELIDQPKARMISYYPDWEGKIGIVMADQDENDQPITIATVQTLNTSERRLAGILANGQIDYLITDEAHHALADSYIKLYTKLKEANPQMKHLGVTATPIRGDNGGLGHVFEKVSGKYGIVELIGAGWLAPVRWLAIDTKINLEDVQISNGDFNQGQLSDLFSTSENFDLVVATHMKYAQGRQGLAFTVKVEDAYHLAEKFNSAGITAEAADGTTDKKRRQRVLDDFALGKIQVLCNVGLYTEGLDVPMASLIHMVRPTRSDGLYTQMAGRALRLYPGKEDALILDYIPETGDRNIAMLGDILTYGRPLNKQAVLKRSKGQGDVIGGLTFDGKFHWMEGSPVEIISTQLNYLQISPWSWYRSEDHWMTLGLGQASDKVERTLAISPPTDGELVMYLVARRQDERAWKSWIMRKADTFDELQAFADQYANYRGDGTLAQKRKAWRKEEPSEAQVTYAHRLGIRDLTGMTRGDVAQLITHKIAVKAVAKNLQPTKEVANADQSSS
jgi:superfamily II DNA or RNA helicase